MVRYSTAEYSVEDLLIDSGQPQPNSVISPRFVIKAKVGTLVPAKLSRARLVGTWMCLPKLGLCRVVRYSTIRRHR